MLDSKKQLSISLTEPVVFLRSSDPSGRLRPDPNDPLSLVRGIVNLNVVKSIEISSIEVELTGVLTINTPDGIGPHRTELQEKQTIYSSTVTVFRADQVSRRRRPASVGPRFSSSDGDDPATALSRPPSLPQRRSSRRSAISVPPDLGPTPAYTPVDPSPTPTLSRFDAYGENPAQALEGLRQPLGGNLEGQTYQSGFVPPSSRPHSIAICPPNPTTQPTSTTSDDSLHQGNDVRTDDMAHPSPIFEGDTSSHSSTEEHLHVHHNPSPSRSSRTHSPEINHGTHPRTRGYNHDHLSGRSRLRLSLSSVLDAVMEITSKAPTKPSGVSGSEERERGRTRVRVIAEEQNRSSTLHEDEANASQPSGYTGHGEHHLLGLGRILGLERDQEEKDGEHKSKEHREGWREFKPGTYSYPISFLLPPHLPPTFSVPHASLNYVIKGVAHRPGTFTSKLTCQVPLLIVAAPAIGAVDGVAGDPGPIIVQKQWEGNLAYSFGLSSRLFILGSQRHLEAAASEGSRANTESLIDAEAANGTTVLELTLLPLEKIKIWRLSVVIDQAIKYVDERGRLFRDGEKRRFKLLEAEDKCPEEEMDQVDEEEQMHKNKQKKKPGLIQIPLLPTPISPHRSPLLQWISPSTDSSVLAGPGPYTLSISIGLPRCNDPSAGDLHFTVKHKKSAVKVEHSLRLVMRVERIGDDDAHGHEEGDKKRLFDISVQTPITILSCRCVPEYQTLPVYSQITEDNSQSRSACPCQPSAVGPVEEHYLGHDHVVPSTSSSSFESGDSGTTGHLHHHLALDAQHIARSRSSSRTRQTLSGHLSPLNTTPLHPHSPSSPVSQAREALSWNRSVGSASHDAQPHSHGHHHHHRSRSNSYSVITSHVRGHSQTPPILTPHPSRPPSPLAQYERLVSGLESEAGEAPPSYYESMASRF